MKICGLQKLTLLDFPGRVAAIVFLGGCNFRCPFCQNSSLVLDPASQPPVEPEEFRRFLKRRSGVLDGICVTGGEPTLYRDLPELFAEIKSFGYQTKLDTNGTNPDMLETLIRDRLIDYAAIDIKAGRDNYARVCGLADAAPGSPAVMPDSTAAVDDAAPGFPAAVSDSTAAVDDAAPGFPAAVSDSTAAVNDAAAAGTEKSNVLKYAESEKNTASGICIAPGESALLARVSRSVRILMDSSIDYEFRTTVVRGLHTEADFQDIAEWIGGCRRYFLQSFRDSEGVLTPDHSFTAFSAEEMRHFLAVVKEKIPEAQLRGA